MRTHRAGARALAGWREATRLARAASTVTARVRNPALLRGAMRKWYNAVQARRVARGRVRKRALASAFLAWRSAVARPKPGGIPFEDAARQFRLRRGWAAWRRAAMVALARRATRGHGTKAELEARIANLAAEKGELQDLLAVLKVRGCWCGCQEWDLVALSYDGNLTRILRSLCFTVGCRGADCAGDGGGTRRGGHRQG